MRKLASNKSPSDAVIDGTTAFDPGQNDDESVFKAAYTRKTSMKSRSGPPERREKKAHHQRLKAKPKYCSAITIVRDIRC